MSAPAARIPSLPRRIVYAALSLITLLIVFVAVPLGVLNVLAAHGIQPPLSLETISAVGIVLAVLGAARTVAKPTRAFGPIALAASGILFLYLFTLARNGVVAFPTGSGGTLQLSYGNAILLVAVAPLLSAIAAVVTMVEDTRTPGERLPYDYPP